MSRKYNGSLMTLKLKSQLNLIKTLNLLITMDLVLTKAYRNYEISLYIEIHP